MGLDMYLRKRLADNTELQEIGGWRKHANLHGYIEHLYQERGGTGQFNCVPLELTKEDCEDILAKSENDDFELSEGFFWGTSHPDHNAETIEYMQKALQAIKDGYTIYYDSWW